MGSQWDSTEEAGTDPESSLQQQRRELLQTLILIPREQLVAVNYMQTIKGEWELATFSQKKNE